MTSNRIPDACFIPKVRDTVCNHKLVNPYPNPVDYANRTELQAFQSVAGHERTIEDMLLWSTLPFFERRGRFDLAHWASYPVIIGVEDDGAPEGFYDLFREGIADMNANLKGYGLGDSMYVQPASLGTHMVSVGFFDPAVLPPGAAGDYMTTDGNTDTFTAYEGMIRLKKNSLNTFTSVGIAYHEAWKRMLQIDPTHSSYSEQSQREIADMGYYTVVGNPNHRPNEMEYAVAAAIINSRGRLHDIIAPYAAEAFGIGPATRSTARDRSAADDLFFRPVCCGGH